MTREQRTVVEGPDPVHLEMPELPKIPLHQEPSLKGAQGITFDDTNKPRDQFESRFRSNEQAEHAALTRLSHDLTLSLPLMLIMSIAFPVLSSCGALLDQTSWAVREIALDA